MTVGPGAFRQQYNFNARILNRRTAPHLNYTAKEPVVVVCNIQNIHRQFCKLFAVLFFINCEILCIRFRSSAYVIVFNIMYIGNCTSVRTADSPSIPITLFVHYAQTKPTNVHVHSYMQAKHGYLIYRDGGRDNKKHSTMEMYFRFLFD